MKLRFVAEAILLRETKVSFVANSAVAPHCHRHFFKRNSCKRVPLFFRVWRVNRIFARWQTKILLLASPADYSLDSVGGPPLPTRS